MDLDWHVCSRARLARDPRFDGKFFIGVRSTKIYCRPICRTRTSLEKNVVYFASAAAAEAAGYRPCLRCRPESSPGTPAWAGTQNTVSRALQLISETGLEDGGVESLAEHLGVGARHLRRLFVRHLGATPSAVAHTRRIHFAKKLIDETRLPMTQVALASGFGCARRFNAAIRKMYNRTPTQIRALARHAPVHPENQYVFHLAFRPPYAWKHMLEFLAARATPGVETVECGTYRRSISLNGSDGQFEVALDPLRDALSVRVQIGDPHLLFCIMERIRAMFDVNADWSVIQKTLRADPILAQRLHANPGLRVPGCWDGFELATRAILGQQITVKGATRLAGRVVKAFGRPFCATGGLTHLFPTPDILAGADLRTVGVIGSRARAIQALACAVCKQQIRFEKIVDSDALLARLLEVPGVGEWTAQYVAMRALREPDAMPFADLGLLRGAGLSNARRLEERSLGWRPWRAYAAMYLWASPGLPELRKLAGLKNEVRPWAANGRAARPPIEIPG
jgi:AraC family transcriptional regulator, regulatory protein of adaptative response / DNA-3-methyladenine glycosylase II